MKEAGLEKSYGSLKPFPDYYEIMKNTKSEGGSFRPQHPWLYWTRIKILKLRKAV